MSAGTSLSAALARVSEPMERKSLEPSFQSIDPVLNEPKSISLSSKTSSLSVTSVLESPMWSLAASSFAAVPLGRFAMSS